MSNKNHDPKSASRNCNRCTFFPVKQLTDVLEKWVKIRFVDVLTVDLNERQEEGVHAEKRKIYLCYMITCHKCTVARRFLAKNTGVRCKDHLPYSSHSSGDFSRN